MKKKQILASDLSGLLATKGQASPSAELVEQRSAASVELEENNVPLNFRVSSQLRRRFKIFAAKNDLKLNELLKLAFEEYESKARVSEKQTEHCSQ